MMSPFPASTPSTPTAHPLSLTNEWQAWAEEYPTLNRVVSGEGSLARLDEHQRSGVASLVWRLVSHPEVTGFLDQLMTRGYDIDKGVVSLDDIDPMDENPVPTTLAALLLDIDGGHGVPGISQMVSHLVNKGTQIEATGGNRKIPLLYMAFGLPHPSNIPLMEVLLAHGADPNRFDDFGPLVFQAINNDENDTAALLLRHGASLAPDEDGTTPLGFLFYCETVKNKNGAPLGEDTVSLALLMIDHGASLDHAFFLGQPIDNIPLQSRLEQALLERQLSSNGQTKEHLPSPRLRL